MLSRVDERIGFKTPQQPIKLGAKTDKVTKSTLDDDFKRLLAFVRKYKGIF